MDVAVRSDFRDGGKHERGCTRVNALVATGSRKCARTRIFLDAAWDTGLACRGLRHRACLPDASLALPMSSLTWNAPP
eukprot:358599-Chlamydomonas_euryale.AAC.3